MLKNLPIYVLNEEKYKNAINFPVFKIEFLNTPISFEGVDFLLFTSKNGVRAIDSLTDEWKKIPAFAIGKATAEEIKKRGGKIERIAKTSYGDEFAKEIVSNYNNKTILFARAKKIISNIKEIFDLSDNILIEKIVYETKCNNPGFNIKKPAFVIFSSPSSVECFLKVENIENVIPIAIGKKTKNALIEHGIEQYLMPKKPLISECITLAKSVKFK